MNGFEYEIVGIANINRILPSNGSWYYQYLKNGNVRVHGTPSDPTSFSYKKFAQKITLNGGYLKTKNNIIHQKHLKMAGNETKNASNATEDQSKSSKNTSTSLETLENEINQLEEIISENNISKAYSKIELTSTKTITDTSNFQKQLDNNLGGKINAEAKAQIKQLIEQIKKELTSGKIISAIYTPPTCKSKATTSSKGASITISKSDCIAATLQVTTEIEVDGVKVSSIKGYPISENLFSTEDITNALAEFTAGRTFLNGLTTATQTFTT